MASTPLSRAHRWMRTHLRDHYGLERAQTPPVHTVMERKCDASSPRGNVWISLSVSLMCYTDRPPTLQIHGNRCGPEAPSTCDGPIEIDYNLPGVPNDSWAYGAFDEGALLALKRTVLNNLPQALKAYHETVDKYCL